jgi:ATP-dependent helicase YprA (DUF1998 family)
MMELKRILFLLKSGMPYSPRKDSQDSTGFQSRPRATKACACAPDATATSGRCVAAFDAAGREMCVNCVGAAALAPAAAIAHRAAMPFHDLPALLAQALAARGYDTPTPVQAAVLEAEAGADLIVSAQTGSGKTVAFGLAMAAQLV